MSLFVFAKKETAIALMKIRQLSLILLLITFMTGCQTYVPFTGDDEEADKDIATEPDLSEREQQQIDNLFFEGHKQRMIGNPDRAKQKFEDIIEIHPGMAVAHYQLAKFHFNNQNPESALYHIERAIESDHTSNIWYRELYGKLLQELENHEKAAEIYADLIEEKPGRKNYYENAIESYSRSEQHQKALDIFETMETRFGATPQTGFQKFRIYSQMGEDEKAIDEVEKLIERHPGDIRYLELLADAFRQQGKEERAYETYYRILDQNQYHVPSQTALLNYYRRNDQPENALEVAKKIFSNPEAEMERKVQIFFETYLGERRVTDNPEEAIDEADQLVSTYPESAETRSLYGDVLYQAGRLEEAKKQYKKSIEYQQDKFPVWSNLLRITSQLGEFEELKDLTSEAETYFPNQPEVFYFSGLAHRQLDELEQSIEELERAATLTVDNEQFQSEIYAQIADTWYMLDKFEKTEEYFNKALNLNPQNDIALNNYSYYLALRSERLDEAQEMSSKSLEINPDNASYLDTYGWIMFQKGNYEKAKEFLSKAYEKEPESEEIVDHFGDVHYKLGNIEKAVEYWEKAHSLSDNSREIKEKIEQRTIVNE